MILEKIEAEIQALVQEICDLESRGIDEGSEEMMVLRNRKEMLEKILAKPFMYIKKKVECPNCSKGFMLSYEEKNSCFALCPRCNNYLIIW